MSKEFDVEQIEGYDLMDEEEKRYFEMYGEEINSQANLVAEENGVNPEEKIKFALMMNSLGSDRSEYIVHGAPLECTMQIDNVQKFKYKGSEIKSIFNSDENSGKLIIQEERTETINGVTPANIEDTKGGIRDTVICGEKKINLFSFGNCKYAEDFKVVEGMAERLSKELNNDIPIDVLAEKMKTAMEAGKGSCYCLMMLNSEWENMPLGYNWYTEAFEINFPGAGAANISASTSYQQYNGKEGINMMSMLFCKCGGIINAKESGQTDYGLYISRKTLESVGFKNITNESLWELNYILRNYDIQDVEEIRHFLSQSVVESFFGLGLTEINWRDYPDTSNDEEYFNKKYKNTNGNSEDGDGYKFRGGGYLHITGRGIYQAFSDYLESLGRKDERIMEEGADIIAKEYAWESAAWFWKYDVVSGHNGTEWVQSDGSIEKITYFVNRGDANLEERRTAYDSFVWY